MLALLSLTLLLLAAAIELWWGVSAYLRRRGNLSHISTQLPSSFSSPSPTLADYNADKSPARMARPWDGLLRRADIRPGWRPLLTFLAVGGALALLAVLRVKSLWAVLPVAALYCIAAWFWLNRRIVRIEQHILRQLPDFLDNMVRMSSVGNSLPMAFQSATSQVAAPLRPLLDATLGYSRTGMDLDEALLKASRGYRIKLLEVLALVLGVSIRIGGRADQVLQRLANFLRDQQAATQELQATTSETRASSWVLGLLPIVCAGFMVLMSPEFFKPMFHEPLGLKLIAGAFAMEVLGGFLLYRLAKSL